MEPKRTSETIGSEQFDRLVDGALSASERQSLLSRLEGEADGWRRCALAFLEAQAWREAIGPLAVSDHGQGTDAPPIDRSRMRIARRIMRPWALAASLAVVAFVLGRVSGGAGRPAPIVRGGDRAVAVIDEPTPDGTAGEIGDPDAEPSTGAIRAVGYLNLATGDGAAAPVMRLPVVAGPGLDENWLREQPSFVPDDLRHRWEDRGYRVEHQRRLVSVQVDDDGRYLSIPVDEVFLHASERPTY